jgi:hypothetical protein
MARYITSRARGTLRCGDSVRKDLLRGGYDGALYCRADGLEFQLRGRRMIRKLRSGKYRLYSRKIDPRTGRRRNLGTFDTRAAAEKHEREVQYFKRRS